MLLSFSDVLGCSSDMPCSAVFTRNLYLLPKNKKGFYIHCVLSLQENATFGSNESLEEFRMLSKTIPWTVVVRYEKQYL
jgi:hypothetical protein